MREREGLQEEYDLLTKKKKVTNGYVKYYKMRFKEISRDNKTLSNQDIGKMATNDWKSLSNEARQLYNKEASEENNSQDLTEAERNTKIEEYN